MRLFSQGVKVSCSSFVDGDGNGNKDAKRIKKKCT